MMPETGSFLGFSSAQRQRLAEMSMHGAALEGTFATAAERDGAFEELHGRLAGENVERLRVLRDEVRRPLIRRLESRLVETLTALGFVEVTTPILMGKGALEKVGLGPRHPLWRQVYWVDQTRCLRPMLAPNLYYLLSHLQRLWPLPVRIFEVGPCFRKESKGASHLSEFTMLNLVELGPEGDAAERLEEIARLVVRPLGLEYQLQPKESEVYGATVDLEMDGLEVASGVAGPHPLDENWRIADPWAGWGLGLERLAMASERSPQIRRFGRSLMYLDGARLNLQAGKQAERKGEEG
ncbi:MAG: pyrrolysine--tRNA(Pyl) ligase large subunit [Thermoleophilia bacterium]|nr:pyrrolysine--tRNA(Pyl) ligase large subunit [Thermoleophilia bacterium]